MTPILCRGIVALVSGLWLVSAPAARAPGPRAGQPPAPPPTSDGWLQAQPGYRFTFPQDHASHPAYRIEWWYYTGNLAAADGRRFGYQLTFFRIGVKVAPSNPSIWAVRDLFMAHLAVTDVAGGRHLVAERLNRAGVGWAGAARDAYRVWNDRWEASLDGHRHRLQARDESFGLELTLEEGGPPVLHGAGGFSQKGTQAGNASLYYSFTRMPTRGQLFVDGASVAVSGSSWMDHEFGTTLLEPEQTGWDWFSIQLNDGADLMVFQLRGRDLSRDPRSSGTLVADGRVVRLFPEMFTLVQGRPWQSPDSRASYPVEWTIAIPEESVSLRVRPAIDAQELSGLSSGVTYWEGSIEVEGTRRGRSVSGLGYLEMTGYAGRPMGELLR